MTIRQKTLLKTSYERLRRKVDESPFLNPLITDREEALKVLEQTAGSLKHAYPKNKSSVQIVNEMRKQWRTAT